MKKQQSLLSNAEILYVSRSSLKVPGIAMLHDYSEVTYVISGSGTYMLGDNTYKIQAGDFMIVNAHQLHYCITINPKEPIVLFSVTLSSQALPFSNSPLQHTSENIRPHLLTLIETMRLEWKEKAPYYKLKVLSCFTEFVVTILRDAYTSNQVFDLDDSAIFNKHALTDKEQILLDKALLFINQHYTEDLSVNLIAENIPVSPTHLNRMFRKAMNISPMQHVIRLRLEKSLFIFRTSPELSVKEVAISCGYSDPYHFSKLFKKHIGVSPSDYKIGKRSKKY